jgi:NADH-quinone oxidoreductase subunit E
MTNPSTAQATTRAALPQQEVGLEERLNEILGRFKGDQGELIPVLQQVQQAFGYVPEAAIDAVARFLHLPQVTVYGVATFYAQFKLTPSGRNVIRVCRGTACHVRGGARILREVEKQLGIRPGETTPDLEFGLETVACIGACALSPSMVVNDRVHGRVTPQKVKNILDAIGKPSE